MEKKVIIKDGILIIHEGDGYYDTRESFEIDKLVKVIEEIGVRGGHVGWSIVHKKLDEKGEWYESEMMMGRKIRTILEEIKELIDTKKLKIGYEIRTDVEQRCF